MDHSVEIDGKSYYHPWRQIGDDRWFRPSLPEGFKRFECKYCGYQYVKHMPSAVCKCPKCELPVIAKGVQEKNLPPYSKIKLTWLRHPEAWLDSIKNGRKIVGTTIDEEGHRTGGRVIMKDSFGDNIGTMPEIVNV